MGNLQKSFLLAGLLIVGCSKNSGLIKNAIPHVQASSEKPSGCSSLGKVNGVAVSTKGLGKLEKYNESLKDIKRSVSSVGGNYLHIQKVLRNGALISGDAYQCDN